MARYIVLANWTDQGVKNVKDSANRLDAAKALAKKDGLRIPRILHDGRGL